MNSGSFYYLPELREK